MKVMPLPPLNRTPVDPEQRWLLDARLIQGSAMSIDCWREANAENIHVLIAVTDNDAVNMLAAMIADRFGIPEDRPGPLPGL
jgi:Trk K+ transport system NAD-binding subunit